MIDKPLTEKQIKEKIQDLTNQIEIIQRLKIKYESDLRYYQDKEYRQRETIYTGR